MMDYHALQQHSQTWDLGNRKEAFSQVTHQSVVKFDKVIPIFLFIFMAPIIGMVISIIITLIIVHLYKRSNPHKADQSFKRLQLLLQHCLV
jgi:PiT family inorganic phosphate transporter